jgi:hypothetical protein
VGVLRAFVACIAAMGVFCAARAGTDGPAGASLLLFAGSDVWRDGAFLDGGLLWTPAGLDAGGFTFKLLLAGGNYIYPSSGLREDVSGTLVSASALPGWRFNSGNVTIDAYAGPIVQDYRLTPYDPGSLLHGRYVGGQFATDVWYQPNQATMIAFDGSLASISFIGAARAAVGWRSSESFFIGPETQVLWCVDYQQYRFGAHVTGVRINGLEWSAAGGWAVESFGRMGPYLRLGVNAKY